MLLNNFVTLQGHNCILGNLYNALNYFNVDISEQDLFFWLSPFDGDRNLPEVFEKFYEEKGDCSWLEFIKKSLNDGRPVMISVHPKKLPYIKVEVGDQFNKHYINIIGIDEEKKQLYVSDSYIPTYFSSIHEGWIDYVEISDSDIGNCWRLKIELLLYFQNYCKLDDIINFTFVSIIKRLDSFLRKNSVSQHLSGIDGLQILSKTVKKHLANSNYDEIFKLLAGIRLNIIDPLIYLAKVLVRYPDEYSESIEKLNSLVKKHWETVNIKLIKFALAHKKLDIDKITEQINGTIELEKEVLNDILKQLLKLDKGSMTAISDILK